MSRSHTVMTEPLAGYMRAVSLREDALLRRLREETAPMPLGVMQISPEQGQFMQMLIRILGARRTLEVGVFTGYSSICVARALPDDGRIMACDVSEEWTSMARRYWREAGVEHKISLRLAPAVQTLQELIDSGDGGYDFAFIDADKENYRTYYEQCLHLLRPGGLIAIDNVLWHGNVADQTKQDPDTVAIRQLNSRMLADFRVDLSMLPVGDGLTLARKR
ncbi:MAG: methyltransferase domain-containing protein [Acidobacteria bacterium]|nr:methyltransferase domain-containing protein [Acidobacteriota bacterium]